jgi:hypothetical protein
MTERRHFVVRFRTTTDSASAIRALRWLLKTALRTFGLRAISVTEEQPLESGDGNHE